MSHVERSAPLSIGSQSQAVRWRPVRNMEREWVPGFALMALDPTDGDDFFTQEAGDGNAIWNVHKPDGSSEARQSPALLMFNGPQPIPPYPKGFGKGTFETPAQVLHNGNVDRLPNGFSCGPLNGKWEVYSGGTAFVCVSHDITEAVTLRGVHTVWVQPNLGLPDIPRGALRGANGLVQAGGLVPLDAAQNETERLGYVFDPDIQGFKCLPDHMTLWVQASATLSSESAPEGGLLQLRVYKGKTSATLAQTYLGGFRKQGLNALRTDNAGYAWTLPFYSAENISFGGPLDLRKNEIVCLKNDGQYSTLYAGAILSAFTLAVGRDEVSGQLNYDTANPST